MNVCTMRQITKTKNPDNEPFIRKAFFCTFVVISEKKRTCIHE